MKKRSLIFILTLLILQAHAQRKIKEELDDQKSEQDQKDKKVAGQAADGWKDKVFFGGNFGGGFSSGGFGSGVYFMIQPIAGYKVTEKFAAGLSPLYMYSSFSRDYGYNRTAEFSNHIIGPGVFLRYMVLDNVFAYTEYLGLSYRQYYWNPNINEFESERKWNNSLFIGGGYLPSGDASGVYISVLYDVLWSSTSYLYPNPLDIRIGFFF